MIKQGPRADLETFLKALAQLDAALEFLQRHRSMQTAADALAHTTALRDNALAQCSTEFAALLRQHSALPLAVAEAAPPPHAGSIRERRASAMAGSGAAAAPAAAAAAAAAATDLSQDPAIAQLRQLGEVLLHHDARACLRSYADVRCGVVNKALERHPSPVGGSREEVARMSWQTLEAGMPG